MHNNSGNPTKIGTTTPLVYDTLPATPVNYSALPNTIDPPQNLPSSSLSQSESDKLVDQLREKVEEGKGGRAERSAQMLQKQVGSQQLSGQNQFPQQQGYTPPSPYPPQQSPARPQVGPQQVQQTYAGPNLPQGYTPPQTYSPQQQNYGQLPKPTAASPHLNLSDPAFQKEMLKTAVMTIVGLTKPKDVDCIPDL